MKSHAVPIPYAPQLVTERELLFHHWLAGQKCTVTRGIHVCTVYSFVHLGFMQLTELHNCFALHYLVAGDFALNLGIEMLCRRQPSTVGGRVWVTPGRGGNPDHGKKSLFLYELKKMISINGNYINYLNIRMNLGFWPCLCRPHKNSGECCPSLS